MISATDTDRHSIGWAVALCVAALMQPAARAQDADEEPIDTLQEVRVGPWTESLRYLPAAITVLNASQVERLGIDNLVDMETLVPNLVLSRAAGGRIYIRGIGEDEPRPGTDPAVPLYVDGVYQGRTIASLVELLDVERLEVLRGPQGTLHGRNAIGGAIHLHTRAPAPEAFMVQVHAGAGAHGLIDLKTVFNLPVTEQSALRMAFLSHRREGVFETAGTAPAFLSSSIAPGQDVGARDLSSYRLSYRHLAEGFELRLAADSTQDDSEPIPANRPSSRPEDLFYLFSPYGEAVRHSRNLQSQGLSAALQWRIGAFTFQSLTAFRTLKEDLDSGITLPYELTADQSHISEEYRVLSNWQGKFNFTAGLSLFSEDIELDYTFSDEFDLALGTSSIGLFAQGSYELNERMRLSFGLRHSSESSSFSGINIALNRSRTEQRDWSHSAHSLAFSYDIDENSRLLVSSNTGFRVGGWSPDAFLATPLFRPGDSEKLVSIELGYRGLFIDGRLRLDATYFQTDYENMHLGGIVLESVARFRVPSAGFSGLEAELSFRLSDDLRLRAHLATLDAGYRSLDVEAAVGLGALSVAGLEDAAEVAAGLSLAWSLRPKNTPEAGFGLGLSHERRIFRGLELELDIDWSYRAESHSLASNTPGLERAATNLLNMRAGIGKSDLWRISFWLKNATDEHYYLAAVSGIGDQVYAADPFTWGIDFRYLF